MNESNDVEPTESEVKPNEDGKIYVNVGGLVKCNLSVPNECGPLADCISECPNIEKSCFISYPYCRCYTNFLPLLENRTCLNFHRSPDEVAVWNIERLKNEKGSGYNPAAYFWLIAVPMVFIFLGVYLYFKKRPSPKRRRRTQMEAQMREVEIDTTSALSK